MKTFPLLVLAISLAKAKTDKHGLCIIGPIHA